MRLLTVAIFNDSSSHYQIFGFLIYWCQKNNHQLIIYTEKTNNTDYLNWYDCYFGPQDYRPCHNFYSECHRYDIVFLITTDNNDNFDDDILDRFNLQSNVVAINCTQRHRNNVKNNLFLKGDSEDLIVPIFPITLTTSHNSTDSTKINIVCKDIDQGTVDTLNRQPNMIVHLIDSRDNIKNTIDLIYHSDYVVRSHEDNINWIALSCGKNIIDSTNNILPLTKNNSKDVMVERDKEISKFDSVLSKFFPHYYEESSGEYNIIIPKNIHLMWLSRDDKSALSDRKTMKELPTIVDNSNAIPDTVPKKYRDNIKLFKRSNPNYTVKIWTMTEILDLMVTYFPEYYEQFIKINAFIQKCDIARFVVVYLYGGWYFDLDFICRRNLDLLTDNEREIFFEEFPEHEFLSRHLFNGCFASVARTEFVQGWIKQMFASIRPEITVFMSTGPSAFWRYYESLPDNSRPNKIFDPCLTMPYTPEHIISSACKNIDPYTHTIWSEGSGWGQTDESSNIVYSVNWIPCTILIILIIITVLLIVYLQ